MNIRNLCRIPLVLLGLVLVLVLGGCRQERDESLQRMQAPEAAASASLEALNARADELYKFAAAGQFLEARQALEQFGELAASASYAGVTGVEGVNALTDAVLDAKRQLNAVRLNPEKIVHSAVRLKLAADALTHKKQPMWLQYYKVLNADTVSLDEAVAGNSRTAALAAFGAIQEHYDAIRPAVRISRAPEEGERMESLLTFFTGHLEPSVLQRETLAGGIRQWRDSLDSLFRKNGDQSVFLPVAEPDQPLLWTLVIGLLTAGVLSLAGWRMIRVERDAVRPPRFRGMDGSR